MCHWQASKQAGRGRELGTARRTHTNTQARIVGAECAVVGSALLCRCPVGVSGRLGAGALALSRRPSGPLGGCGCNHGSQCARQHGQGRTAEADREHEVPGQHGPMAPLQEHRRVSTSIHASSSANPGGTEFSGWADLKKKKN